MNYQDLNKIKPAEGTLCSVADEHGETRILMWLWQRWWEYAYDEPTNTSSFVLIKEQQRYTKWIASPEDAIEVHTPAPTDNTTLLDRIERLEKTVSLLYEQVFQ